MSHTVALPTAFARTRCRSVLRLLHGGRIAVHTLLTHRKNFALVRCLAVWGIAMISIVLGPTLGMSPGVILPCSIAEGIVFTVMISLLAERYLFPTRQVWGTTPNDRRS
jgi:hypothetical protein